MKFTYFKISYEDLDLAREVLDNEKHYGEFLACLIDYYRTQEIPKFKSKAVEKYFKTYKKTADFILKQKTNGEIGGLQRAENEKNKHESLEANLEASSKVTAKPKTKDKLNNKLNNNLNINKENNISEFDKQIRTRCRNLFLDVYRTNNHTEYYWTPKDATNMNQLIQKVRVKVIEKFGELNESDLSERIYESMNILLTKQTDTWVLNNLSYPTLNSKFNDIYSQLKNSQNGTSNSNPEHAKIFNAIKHLIK